MTLYPTGQPATLRFVFSRMDEEKGNLLDLSFRAEDGRVLRASFTATPSHIAVATGGSGAPHAIVYIASAFDAVIDTEGLGPRHRIPQAQVETRRLRLQLLVPDRGVGSHGGSSAGQGESLWQTLALAPGVRPPPGRDSDAPGANTCGLAAGS